MGIDSVDSNPSMTTPKEAAPQDVVKLKVLKDSIGPITGRIRRIVNPTEVLSLGFVLEKKWNPGQPTTSDSFIKDSLGLNKEDEGHTAEMKIYKTVYEAYKRECNDRLAVAAAAGNQPEQDKLNALWAMKQENREFTEAVFNKGNSEIHLGGVPEYWLPDWVKTFK